MIFDAQRNTQNISIHVLREEDDNYFSEVIDVNDRISIHVLREEDDNALCGLILKEEEFQSTSSARRTTATLRRSLNIGNISIHVLREEDDD